MTIEEFIEIMADDNDSIKTIIGEIDEDNVFAGLKILTKYIIGAGIAGADHDIIYSVGIEDIVKAGITKEDVIMLRSLNWMVEDEEYLACFV